MGTWRPRGRRSAFTLFEMVTVMALLAIVAVAVGGPTLSYVDSIRSRAAAARLVADIRYLQRTALASGLRTWAVFDAGSDNYQLYIEDRDNPGKAGRLPLANPLDQTTAAVQFGSGPYAKVSISSVSINATAELEIDGYGVPYDGNQDALTATGQISLSSGVTITVHPVSGFVERAG
jgi:prepilin-type N-terminal cleavage/methylation domain-containing protein